MSLVISTLVSTGAAGASGARDGAFLSGSGAASGACGLGAAGLGLGGFGFSSTLGFFFSAMTTAVAVRRADDRLAACSATPNTST